MNCVSCDICVYHLGLLVFFPRVFLSSRVTGACPVTTDLIMRVNVKTTTTIYVYISFFYFFRTLLLSRFWTSRGHRCRPFSPRFLPSIFIAHRVQQSRCSSIFHRELLIHALALSASQFVRKKKSPRIYTSMHSGVSNSRN